MWTAQGRLNKLLLAKGRGSVNRFGTMNNLGSVVHSCPTRSHDQGRPRLSLFASSRAAHHIDIKFRDPITAALTQLYCDVVREDLPEEIALMIEDIDRAIAVSERVK